jgi:hypothetical protein
MQIGYSAIPSRKSELWYWKKIKKRKRKRKRKRRVKQLGKSIIPL